MKAPLLQTALINSSADDIAWQRPVVFKQDHQESAPYPVDALPGVIQNAVSAYQKYGQQPLPLIACSALANVSLATPTTMLQKI